MYSQKNNKYKQHSIDCNSDPGSLTGIAKFKLEKFSSRTVSPNIPVPYIAAPAYYHHPRVAGGGGGGGGGGAGIEDCDSLLLRGGHTAGALHTAQGAHPVSVQ